MIPAVESGSNKTSEQLLDILLYRDLIGVKRFYSTQATLHGSAKELGLVQAELTDFVNLRFKNLFTGFTLEEIPKDKEGLPKKDINPGEWASLTVKIWTVGKDYPVAYHVELKMEKLFGGVNGYQDAALGYASAKTLKDERVLKDTISDLIERAAVTLFKIQGKM